MEVQIRTRAIILGLKASIFTDDKGNLSVTLNDKKAQLKKAKEPKKVSGQPKKKGSKHA